MLFCDIQRSVTIKMNILIFLPFFLLLCWHEADLTELPGVPKDVQEKYGQALEAIFAIGIRLQVLLQDATAAQQQNFVVSPFSASLLIGQLMLGAQGKFREYLYEIMSLPNAADHSHVVYHSSNSDGLNETFSLPHAILHLQLGSFASAFKKSLNNNFTLQTASALFYDMKLTFREQFEKNLVRIYDNELIGLNFNSSRSPMITMNSWAASNTNNLIRAIVYSPPPPTTSAIFANALYFKAYWETPFSAELNTVDAFKTSAKSTVNVTYMLNLFEAIPYADSAKLDCKIIGLPYRNRDATMYMILPNKNNKHEFNIRDFAKQLKPVDILELISHMEDKEVSVKIPKLSLSTNLSLLEPLKQYAEYKRQMRRILKKRKKNRNNSNVLDKLDDKIQDFEAFINSSMSHGSDISGIYLNNAVRESSLLVSNILQQITLSVDENGTEAAAVTSGTIEYMSTKSFLANKPFLFMIRHEATAAVLFWGAIVNPANSN